MGCSHLQPQEQVQRVNFVQDEDREGMEGHKVGGNLEHDLFHFVQDGVLTNG